GRRIAGTARAFRHSGYCDTDREESLPVGPASRPLSAAALELTTLDIGEKVRLLRVIGRADSGNDAYSAVASQTGDDGGARLGLLWGLLLFSQGSGAIGRVLRRAAAREQRAAAAGTPLPPEQTLARVFGDGLAALLQATDPDRTPDAEERLAPIAEGVLWAEPWLARFRAAGALPHVQAAQNEEGVLEIFDRMLPIAAALGLSTPRQLALLVDRAVHMGVGAARSWIMRTAGPIRTQADRDATLALLGAPSLVDFQRSCGLPPDGQWGPITHAALAGALRRRGGGSGPALLDAEGVVRALLDASRTTDFADRMAAIASNAVDFDDAVAYEVTGA
ncbi:MAG TPA: hypothetical protein VG755_26985, partial [Nannocystaceae bacterium]|nr:hypothetical protein [Nannocystaceae bacterium]